MARNIDEVTASVSDALRHMRRAAMYLWSELGHEVSYWHEQEEVSVGWWARCPVCGMCVGVQTLDPQGPLALGLAVVIESGRCGDRTYVNPAQAVKWELRN